MWPFYISAFVGSATLCAFLTRIVRDVAVHRRCLDAANNGRHFHTKSVPRVGGIALFIAFIGTSAAGFAVFARGNGNLWLAERDLFALGIPAFLIVLLGLYDDLFSVAPRWKLAIEGIAAASLYIGGFGIHSIGHLLSRSDLRIPVTLVLTIFWVLLNTNAFNLIDGLDGLACGSALAGAVVIFIVSICGNTPATGLLAAALAGSVLGFLPYNFHPATIFLGDSGSLLLGFLLSALSFSVRPAVTTATRFALPVFLLGLPIADVTWTVARRLIGQKPIFNGDDEHIHHKLLKRGFSHRGAVLILYSVVAGFALLSVILLRGAWTLGLVLPLAAVGVWCGIRGLNYAEYFELAAIIRRFRERRQFVASNIALRRGIEALLAAPPDFAELCRVLQTTLQPLGFLGISFRLTLSKHRTSYGFDVLKQNASCGFDTSVDQVNAIVAASADQVSGIVAHFWRPRPAAPAVWELRLPLISRTGGAIGEIRLTRDLADAPLCLDMNLLSNEFRACVADALARAVLESPSTPSIASHARRPASPRTVRTILPRT